MEDNRAFLSELLDQEIYLIKESDKEEYTRVDENPELVAEETSIAYHGSNSSGVAIIIDGSSSEDEIVLLDKILGSVNLTRQEVALIKINDEIEETLATIAEIDSRKIISFGITSGKSRLLDIQTKYSPASIEDRTVIIADSLSEINQNTDLKRMLWNCLKEVF